MSDEIDTGVYRDAVNGIGPTGFFSIRYEWKDKPLRTVMRLCDEIDRLRELIRIHDLNKELATETLEYFKSENES